MKFVRKWAQKFLISYKIVTLNEGQKVIQTGIKMQNLVLSITVQV